MTSIRIKILSNFAYGDLLFVRMQWIMIFQYSLYAIYPHKAGGCGWHVGYSWIVASAHRFNSNWAVKACCPPHVPRAPWKTKINKSRKRYIFHSLNVIQFVAVKCSCQFVLSLTQHTVIVDRFQRLNIYVFGKTYLSMRETQLCYQYNFDCSKLRDDIRSTLAQCRNTGSLHQLLEVTIELV
jgi:hypothetical protein